MRTREDELRSDGGLVALVILAMHHQNGDVDRLQVVEELRFRQQLPAAILQGEPETLTSRASSFRRAR